MPVYVYRNLVTNETFEVKQRITEDALTTDPRTGDPVRRVIQPVGIAFKGAGFYVNDSRSTNGKAAGSAAPGTPKDQPAANAPAAAVDAASSGANSPSGSAGSGSSSADGKPASAAASAG